MDRIATTIGRLPAIALVVLVATACGASLPTDSVDDVVGAVPDAQNPATGNDQIPPSATQIPPASVDTLFQSSVSGVAESRRQVIRDMEEMAAAWNEVTSPFLSDVGTEAPDVDFASVQVLLLAMGERPSGGYAIEAGGMAVAGDTLYVEVVETAPGPSCITTMALTQPVLLLAVPTSAAEVAYVERMSVQDCS